MATEGGSPAIHGWPPGIPLSCEALTAAGVRERFSTCFARVQFRRVMRRLEHARDIAPQSLEPPRHGMWVQNGVAIACGRAGFGQAFKQPQMLMHLDEFQVRFFRKRIHHGRMLSDARNILHGEPPSIGALPAPIADARCQEAKKPLHAVWRISPRGVLY